MCDPEPKLLIIDSQANTRQARLVKTFNTGVTTSSNDASAIFMTVISQYVYVLSYVHDLHREPRLKVTACTYYTYFWVDSS